MKSIEDGGWTNETNDKGHQALFQLMLDANFFNGALNMFTQIDKTWSVRKLMNDRGNGDALNELNTSTLG